MQNGRRLKSRQSSSGRRLATAEQMTAQARLERVRHTLYSDEQLQAEWVAQQAEQERGSILTEERRPPRHQTTGTYFQESAAVTTMEPPKTEHREVPRAQSGAAARTEPAERPERAEKKAAKKSRRKHKQRIAPTGEQLNTEWRRELYRLRYRRVLRSTISLLIIAAAGAILVVTLWMPVLQVYGTSMTPTLEDNEIVVLMKYSDFQTGDVIAFYYNNKILVKRVIAQAGDWVDIDEDGTVWVNGVELDEPYLSDKALGECDIELPYQVPEDRVFVLGDHRSVSVDSRSSQVGCVAAEQIVGKLTFRVWPLSRAGTI